jgi:hypothetical protein
MGGGPSHNVFGQYGNFMNDPAAQLATQFGQTAFKQGTQYLEQNVGDLSASPPSIYLTDSVILGR